MPKPQRAQLAVGRYQFSDEREQIPQRRESAQIDRFVLRCIDEDDLHAWPSAFAIRCTVWKIWKVMQPIPRRNAAGEALPSFKSIRG
jgi:hypothetical protein